MTGTVKINCDEALRRLFEYLDHELDAQRHAEVEEHLRTCRACYSRAEFERRLKGRLAELGEVSASQALVQRVRRLLESY
jgi:anti-sigma factor (TIGR02949 family)